MDGPAARVKVLSVVGAGRSGTTVLASMLGEVDGIASAGELRWLWEHGVVEERPCACGLLPRECPVWGGVIERVAAMCRDRFGEFSSERLIGWQRDVTDRRHLRRVLRSARGGDADWPKLARVRAVLSEEVQAFRSATGARVVVDTSKRPQDAAVLAGLPDVDHYVLQLVRDPRAVVYSWQRSKSYTVGGVSRAMGTRRLPKTVQRWTANCLTADLLRRRLPPARWLRLRYEDFCRSPRDAVRQVLDFITEPGEVPFDGDHRVLLGPSHIVAGNPSRFTTGAVEIRLDEQWRTGMRRRDQLAVVATAFPLMLRYGYRVNAGRRWRSTTTRRDSPPR